MRQWAQRDLNPWPMSILVNPGTSNCRRFFHPISFCSRALLGRIEIFPILFFCLFFHHSFFFSHFSPFSPLFCTGIHFINSLINKDYYNMTELCTVTSNFYTFLGESTLETTKKVPFTPKCLPQIFWGCFQGDSGRFMKCRRNAEEGTEIRVSPWQSGRVDRYVYKWITNTTVT